MVFGAAHRVQPRLATASVVACFDADPLFEHPAALRLAREFGRPLVVTGRGTDLNLLPTFAGPRRKILEVDLPTPLCLELPG